MLSSCKLSEVSQYDIPSNINVMLTAIGSTRQEKLPCWIRIQTLPSCLDFTLTILMTILPMPAYSSTDPASGLSSTCWPLAQPEDFQRLHIPVPYDEDPTCPHPHPPFPVPAGFGGPLELGRWKNSKPSWIQAVPQVIEMSQTTTVRNFSAGCNH